MIYVDPAKLAQAAANFETHERNLRAILSQLEADLAPLIASWAGSAQEMYVDKKGTWDAAANDLAGLLASITSVTRDAHQGYVDTITANKNMWT
jgi:early secretory antigenic target protein ESAT-6